MSINGGYGVENMTVRHQETADKIVATFKQSLDKKVAQQITEAQYTALTLMVKEAMGEEARFAVEQLEKIIQKLRTESEKPDLGM
jgi:NAD(P)H-dependent flavin oxidoreductase YrpB (nitropropane dioxygenase family)